METIIRHAVLYAVAALAAMSAPRLYAETPDFEAMKRSLELQISLYQQVNNHEQRGGDPVVAPHDAGAGAAELDSGEAAPVSEVCRCQGYKHSVCKCLKAGVKCHCSRTSGSVWELLGEQWVKTGAKADPRITTSRKAPSESSPSAALGAGYDVTLRNDGRWWWHDGSIWRYTSTQPRDGMRFGSGNAAFVYRDGVMQPSESQMVIDIAPKGHWERRCYGGYCRNVWIPE